MGLNFLLWTVAVLFALYYVIKWAIEGALRSASSRVLREIETSGVAASNVAQFTHDVLLSNVFVDADSVEHSGDVKLCRRLSAIICAGINMDRENEKLLSK